MTDIPFNITKPENEPIKNYAPNSPEKKSLKTKMCFTKNAIHGKSLILLRAIPPYALELRL